MKNIIINKENGIKRRLSGEIDIPSSKSLCHRAIICASLSKGSSNLSNLVFSDDIAATCDGMRGFGANIERKNDILSIESDGLLKVNNSIINCNESGSTLRFLIPLALTTNESFTFTGRGKLAERPLDAYYHIFRRQKIEYKNNDGNLPLTVKGALKPAVYDLPGDVSSQFVSGLLFALPRLEGDSRIHINRELESKPYVDLTIDLLKKHSIEVENNDYKEFIIKGNQNYKANSYEIEGDFSQVAFWLVAGALGADIDCNGLNIHSLQGDRAIIDIMADMNVKVSFKDGKLSARADRIYSRVIDASQCPDLVPILAVLASFAEGTTEIINAQRLRIKESDRLKAISTELNKIGAELIEKPKGLVIRGKEFLKGGIVESWNDHRIAMALAIASIRSSEPVIIRNADCVRKSYPDFWKDFKSLGGEIDEWNMG